MVAKNLLSISKAEAQELRKMFPDVEIYRTVKQKSKRGHFYLCENRKHLNALAKIRNVDVKSMIN